MSDSVTTTATSTYDPLTGITWDTKLSGSNITVYMYPAAQTVVVPSSTTATTTYTTTPINAYQASRYTAALQAFSAITNLTFQMVTVPQAAQIQLAQADFPAPTDESTTLLGFAFPPGTSGVSGLAMFNTGVPAWSSAAGGTLEPGGNAFTTLIHELGHALGLAHPHDDGGGSTIFPGVTSSLSGGTYDLNQGIYTMMSYRDGWYDGPSTLPAVTLAYGEESTPMAFDVAALQAKYGANMGYRTGDDTYTLPDQNGTDTSYQCIWDAGGSNTMAYLGAANAIIDLRPATLQYAPGGGGYVSYVDGVRGGYTIAKGVSIQTALGGSGNDQLTGNDNGCYLDAGTGNNTIIGGAGNDTIHSSGNDIIAAGAGSNLVALVAGSSTVFSTGSDTVVTGAGAAVIGVQAGGADVVFGASGRLTFIGGAQASTVVGGAGSETLFAGAGGGVFSGGSGGGNVILAGTGASTVFGGGANDVIFAQGSGQVLVAGAGNETLNGTGATGGTVIYAGSGADFIAGSAGSDVIFGGTGQSTVLGGGGANLYAFRQGTAGQMVINDFNQAAGDKLTLLGFAGGAAQSALAAAQVTGAGTILTLSDNTRITLSGVQSLQGTAFI
jgi:Ca2+-binding RTX toxin-like protein